jgi:CheY-like chemotaxis protein
MIDGTSNSTVVLVIGLLGGLIAQIFTLITLRFNAKQAKEKDDQHRAWEVEDRKASLAATSALSQHVQASGERLAAAIADNTQKTVNAASAADAAFAEANSVNEKIAAIGKENSARIGRIFGPPPLIFVVEDNSLSLKLTRQQLLGAGYLVQSATTAEAALAALTQTEGSTCPDLVLVDLHFPRMDGLELTRLLRKHGLSIPIIAYTGFTEAAGWNPQEAYDAGCDGYIEKSGDLDLLPRVLAQHLRLAKMQLSNAPVKGEDHS